MKAGTMKKRSATRRLDRSFETLEARTMFASLATVNVGASCSSLVTNGNPESGLFSNSATKAKPAAKPEYSYSSVGNVGDKLTAPISGGLALMGGGTEVDEAFRWLATKANGGDFVVLGTSSTKYYNNYISDLASLDSVETLIVPTFAAANDPFVYDKIANAEAIFITGGDQATYVNNWSDSGVEDALYAALQRDVPIGGSSAGLAILGDVDFSARISTISSGEALSNPLDDRITLDKDFLTVDDVSARNTSLELVDDVITDSHFMQRDRMGRMLAFMAVMDADNLVPGIPRGIAVNEQTALLVEANGSAAVVGNAYSKKRPVGEQQRTVYLLEGAEPATVTGAPLNYSVYVQSATYNPVTGESDEVDLTSWTVVGADVFDVIASSGVLSSSTGSIYG